MATRYLLHQLKPYMSEYLNGEYKRDTLQLNHIDYSPNNILGNYTVVEHYIPTDGVFHLTVPLAFVAVAQLAVISACLDNNLMRKTGEVFLREYYLRCRRPVNQLTDLEFRLSLTDKCSKHSYIYYRGQISVSDNAFVGYASFVFPTIKIYHM